MFDFRAQPVPRTYWQGELEDFDPGGAVYECIERLDAIAQLQAPAYVGDRGILEGPGLDFWNISEWMTLRRAGESPGHYVGEERLVPHDVDGRIVHEALCPQMFFDPDVMSRLVEMVGLRPVSLFAQRNPNIVLEWMRGVANGDDSYGGLDRVLESHPDMYFLLDACRCSEVCLEYVKGSPVLLSLLAMALIEEHGLHSRVRGSLVMPCLYALSWIVGPGLGPLRAVYNTGYALRRARDVCDTDPPGPVFHPYYARVFHLYHCSYGQICLRLHYLVTTLLGSVAVALEPNNYGDAGPIVRLCRSYREAIDAKWVYPGDETVRRHHIARGRFNAPRPTCCPPDGWWVGDTSVPETVYARAMTYRVGFLDEGPDAGVLGQFWRSELVRTLCHGAEIRERRMAEIRRIAQEQAGGA